VSPSEKWWQAAEEEVERDSGSDALDASTRASEKSRLGRRRHSSAQCGVSMPSGFMQHQVLILVGSFFTADYQRASMTVEKEV
jgi:hypothetical protein